VRVRLGIAAALAVATALLLSACSSSNVGIAAKYDGQRLTETQLGNYVTPHAQGVSLSQTGGPTPPKDFALFILIRERLYADLLRSTKGGMPQAGRVAALVDNYVGNGTPQQAVTSLGVKGYSPSFATQVLRYRALGQLLDQRVQSGVDVNAALKTLNFPVTINPRFGTWDRKQLTLKTGSTDGVPGFLTLQPGGGSAASLSG